MGLASSSQNDAQLEQTPSTFEHKDLSVREFVKQRANVRNAAIFMLMGITCSFCYYLLNFYVKYMPGNIFVNQIGNSLAEALSNGIAYLLLRCMNIKRGYFLSFLICSIASLFLMIAVLSNLFEVVPVFILLTKSSI